MTSDTSASVKLRWEETLVRVVEADVPVDQLPDSLIEIIDDTQWSIATGDVDSHVVADFLDALDMAGAAREQSLAVESRTILDAEAVPPILVAAAPISALEVRIAEDDLPVVPQERFAEYAEETTAITGITECERTGDHQPQSDHRWQECPAYHDNGSIE